MPQSDASWSSGERSALARFLCLLYSPPHMTRLPGCHHTKSVMVCKHSSWRKPDSPFIKHSLVFRTHSLALYSYHGSINVGQVSSAIGFDWLWNKYVNTSPFPPLSLSESAQHLGRRRWRPPEAICNVLGAPAPRHSLAVKIHGALINTQKIPRQIRS